MDARNEILDAIQILIGRALESTTKIYNATCKGLVSGNVALMRVNGVDTRVVFYGDVPDVNKQYRVFVPEGNMSNAFMITGGGTGSSKPTVVDYNALVGKPSINGTTVQGNQTSKDLKLYGDGNQPPYPVTSVNGQTGDVTIEVGGVTSVNAKTGAVVLTQDDVGNGTTYVRTHNDFTDAAKQQINTNEDNIAMLDSDMEAAQGDITTLKGNVTTLTTALQSKQDNIVGGASTITDNNLAANRALVSDGNGKVAVSNVTSTELGYLDGVTSNVQTQLNKKLESAPVTSVNTKTGAVVLSASDVGAVAISDVTQTLGSSTTKVPSEKAVADALSGAGAGDMLKATYDPTGSVAQAGGIPDYVAGQLPTVNDATLTIQKNGTTVGTFTANASANKSINITMAKGDVGLSNVDNVKQYSASNPPPYPVTSVAGKTGKVTLTKSNVGLGNVDNVKQYSASNPPPYPVTSVNGKTGAVNLDIPTIPDNLVKYNALSPVEATTPVNADTLQGHAANYFATASGLSAVEQSVDGKLDKAGGTMLGALIAQANTNYATAQVRNIIISPNDPSGGNNGDIWIKYVE